MWEAFTVYGHDTQYKGLYYEYDEDTNAYSSTPVDFWFSYVSGSSTSELIQPLTGFYTSSTSNEIYVDGHLEIPFKENDRIEIDGSLTMIVKISEPRKLRKGIRTFDFQPSENVRRFLVLS